MAEPIWKPGWVSHAAPPRNHAKNFHGGYDAWIRYVASDRRPRTGAMLRTYRSSNPWHDLSHTNIPTWRSEASVLDYVTWHAWSAFCMQWYAVALCMLLGAESTQWG